MLKFIPTGPESGDCTAPYDVEWVTKGRRTFGEFVASVLMEKPDEWGNIYMVEAGKSWMDAPFVAYKNGSVVRTAGHFRAWDSDREIDSVTSRGGWSNMDYYVRFMENLKRSEREYGEKEESA